MDVVKAGGMPPADTAMERYVDWTGGS